MTGTLLNTRLQTESGGRRWYGHLNGLKGMACLLVMLGHYVGIYQYAGASFPSIPLIDTLSRISDSLFDEGYWLYLFFVVSGYLAAQSSVGTPKDLLLKAVNRFLRLALPVLFSCLLIFLLSRLPGFHAQETATLFQSPWYQGAYTQPVSLKDALLSPFAVLLLGDARLNAPYWVLRSMLAASILIYLLGLVYERLRAAGHESAGFSVLMLVTVLSCSVDPVITACLAGAALARSEKGDIHKTPAFALWMILLVRAVYLIPLVVRPVLFFSALVLLIPRVPLLNRIFSSRAFQFLGKISWGIYSFHWPLTCSVGALCLLGFSGRLGLKAAYGFTFPVVLLATLLLSLGFYYSFERFSFFLTRRAAGTLKRLLK